MTSLVTFILSTVQCYIVLNFDDDMDDARKKSEEDDVLVPHSAIIRCKIV